jgi:glycosyltransferase involved in cell wall biosynthesis
MANSGLKRRASVLFIGKRHYTNRDAFSERYGRIFQLPWHWARGGMPVRLWLLDYHGSQAERAAEGSLEIISTPLRRVDWLVEWLRIVAAAVGHRRPQTVVASGDCYIGLLGYALARLVGARFVFDVYDKYDEFGGYRRLLGFKPFPYLLARADAILFASRALLDSLGTHKSVCVLVPNGVDQERFRPLDKLAARRERGLPEKSALVGYFGSMEPDRGVPDLIAAVQILRGQGSDVQLLLGGRLGPGVDVSQPGVTYVGNVGFADMPTMLASCDVLAVPYRRSTFMDAGASNKIAEALACGRPLVATRTPNLIANFPGQVSVLGERLAEPGDIEDLARVLSLQLADPILSPMPENMAWRTIACATACSLGLPIHDTTSPVTSQE